MSYRTLLDQLEAAGDLTHGWRQAFEAVPRRRFIPDLAQALVDGEMVPIDRRRDPDGWAAAVDTDQVIVTQLDNGTVPAGLPGRHPTSSCSTPSMVALMLATCDIEDGHRVLEIGTGTGWNAALLAHRLGDTKVVTVEIDPAVAGPARKALAGAGLHPTVVVGDGERGWPDGAPYDRVLATCAAYRVPYPWVEQTRPGGLIVTPWTSPLGRACGGLLRLTVADGAAAGRFTAGSSFMCLRDQVLQVPPPPAEFAVQAAGSRCAVDLAEVREDLARFVIGLMVPDCQPVDFYAEDELLLRADGSWASVEVTTGEVRQLGPRRLWDEIETAYRWWEQAGRPYFTRFGLTVTPDRQWVWLDEPAQPVGVRT